MRSHITKRFFTAFTLCILAGLATHPHVSATAPTSDYRGVFEFGSISAESDEIRRTFVISNDGNDPLKIKNALCSSDLVQILSYPQEISPHENAEIELRVIPFRAGDVNCEIVLETKNASDAVLRYALKGIIEGENSGEKKDLEHLEVPSRVISRKLRKRYPAFGISAESVLGKLKKKEKIVLIDVRNREEFEKFRIPGSMNIPLFTIKTKGFLKSKPLVLINEGYHYGPLEQECKHLMASGFTAVWVLNGGLSAWREKGAPLCGDIFVQDELNRMPPQIFFEEKNDESWLVVDVSKSESSEGKYFIPHALAVPFGDNAEQFVSRIKTAIGRHKTNPFLSVLIFNETGEQYEGMEKLIQEAGIENVFYLKGGLNGYEEFLRRQALMWQPKKHSTKTLKKCASCP